MSTIPDHTPLAEVRNLGPASVSMLEQVDVHTAGDVRHLGIPLLMHILKQRGIPANMNLAYALDAGLRDVHWLELSDEDKTRIRTACLPE